MPVVVDFATPNPRPYPGTGILWEPAVLPNAIGNWGDIAYGRGYFVGVSFAGALNSCSRSLDGYDWQAVNMPAALQWQAIDYGEGVFCAVAQNGAGNQFARSVDNGATWAPIAEPANLQWQDLCYCGASTWVAVAQNGAGNQFARSTNNGASWVSVAEPANLQWQACVADPITGVVVACAQNGVGNQMARSPNRGAAGSWGSIAESIVDTWGSIAFGNGIFVVVTPAATTNVMRSTDYGLTYSTEAINHDSNYGIAYGNGRFVTANSSSNIYNNSGYSRYGVDWQTNYSRNLGAGGSIHNARSICYGLDRFVTLGNNVTMNACVS